MLADAWATALFVLGPEHGPRKARELGLAAYGIVRTPRGGEKIWKTPDFPHVERVEHAEGEERVEYEERAESVEHVERAERAEHAERAE